jgi:RHS repeat-associated protein
MAWYEYDANGNMTARTGHTFQDPFDTKDAAAWGWSSYQTVYNDGGNNVIKSSGTGSDYSANFYRSSYNLADGEGVEFRFRVDRTDTASHFMVEANDSPYSRFGAIAHGGRIYVQYNDGSGWQYPGDLITNLQANTWYVVRIVVNYGGDGFSVKTYQEDDPSVCGSYSHAMPVRQWRFRHWIYLGNAYIDDYQELGLYDLTYTPENKVETVTNQATGEVTTFTYDGDGNRVKKVDPSGTTTYVGGYYEVQGSTVTKYYYAGTQRVAMRQGGAVTYLHGDHLGSTSLVTNDAGGFVARVLYYPYGEERYEEGTLPTDYGFTGQRRDSYTQLIQMGDRWYDAQLGRWISADTIVPDPVNPQSFNRYSYVYDNPLKYVDPTGHDGEPPEDGVSPITIRSFYLRDNLVVDCVSYSPGTSGVIDTGEWGIVGTEVDIMGFVFGVCGAGADIAEVLTIPWVDEAVSVGDVILTTFASTFQGEAYYGRPHPDLPPMFVLSQDMVLTAGELGIGVVADTVGSLLGPEGIAAGEAVDWITSGLSAIYDGGRLINAIPTEGAVGIYQDDDGVLHIVMLDYHPAENGEETLQLGEWAFE